VPPEDEEEAQVLEGPDPRTWPGREDIWGPFTDLRVIDQVAAALKGEPAMDGMSDGYEEARRFLRVLRQEACEQLSLVILSTYGVMPGSGTGASPFSGAGKPRAFGADSPPAGNLPGRAARSPARPGTPGERGEIRARPLGHRPAGPSIDGQAPFHGRYGRRHRVNDHRLGSRPDLRSRGLRR
jgi:hypothetical protein